MKKKIRAIIIMLLFAGVVLGVYYKMNYTSPQKEGDAAIPKTTVEKLLAKDLSADYPATAKTVMKLYSQYSKCFYDKEYTKDQLKELVEQYRMLLDEELIANNPLEDHLKSLNDEINVFSGEKKVIASYTWPNDSKTAVVTPSPDGTLDDTDETNKVVSYYTKDNKKYASTIVTFTLKQGTTTVQESKEKFVLRQDAEGHWKILGWGLMK